MQHVTFFLGGLIAIAILGAVLPEVHLTPEQQAHYDKISVLMDREASFFRPPQEQSLSFERYNFSPIDSTTTRRMMSVYPTEITVKRNATPPWGNDVDTVFVDRLTPSGWITCYAYDEGRDAKDTMHILNRPIVSLVPVHAQSSWVRIRTTGRQNDTITITKRYQ